MKILLVVLILVFFFIPVRIRVAWGLEMVGPSPVKVQWSKEEVIKLIKDYSAKYKIDPTLPLRIAKAESNHKWDAVNKRSGACGIYQFLPSTFRNTAEGKQGLSCKSAEVNVKAAIRHMSVHGYGAWNASKHIWSK